MRSEVGRSMASTFSASLADRWTLISLNLTVANQVHIIEPQWNPSVEEQAVARAVRMGQKREVTIYRYVLQNTVEQVILSRSRTPKHLLNTFQNIVKLQEKKRRLAKYTLGAKSDQSISDAVQVRIFNNHPETSGMQRSS